MEREGKNLVTYESIILLYCSGLDPAIVREWIHMVVEDKGCWLRISYIRYGLKLPSTGLILNGRACKIGSRFYFLGDFRSWLVVIFFCNFFFSAAVYVIQQCCCDSIHMIAAASGSSKKKKLPFVETLSEITLLLSCLLCLSCIKARDLYHA